MTPSPASNEQATIGAIAESLAFHVAREHAAHTIAADTPARRDAHPKHHGCVSAVFTIDPGIPAEYRRGIFAADPGTQFSALVRFSNAFKVRHDLDRDARGMAIKLRDVKGQRVRLPDVDGARPELMDEGMDTQDFLLVTHSEFFAATAADFMDLLPAIVSSRSTLIVGLRMARRFFGINPPRFKWRNQVAIGRTFVWTANPLYLSYFSQTPYRFGSPDQPAAKFCVRPLQRITLGGRIVFSLTLLTYQVASLFGVKTWKKDLLRKALNKYLAKKDAEFEFCVQLRMDPERMPLDDATRHWPTEGKSAFRRVAHIRVVREPRYETDPEFARGRMALGERLTFTPWHALAAHEPLGSVNLARLFAYVRISRLRHAINGRHAATRHLEDARVPREEYEADSGVGV